MEEWGACMTQGWSSYITKHPTIQPASLPRRTSGRKESSYSLLMSNKSPS